MAALRPMPMPQNTHAPGRRGPRSGGQTAQALPDWLMQQQTILRTAPTAYGHPAALRHLLAERAMLIARIRGSSSPPGGHGAHDDHGRRTSARPAPAHPGRDRLEAAP